MKKILFPILALILALGLALPMATATPVLAAYPSVQSVTETEFSTAAQTHNVQMPATVEANDLLIVLFTVAHSGSGDPATVTMPSGWTALGQAVATGMSSDVRLAVYYKKAAGTEDEAPGTVDFQTDSDARAAAQVYRISASSWHGTTAPAISTAATDTTNSDDRPDPNSLSPSWGAADTLWIAAAGFADDAGTTDGTPTNYADGVETQGVGDPGCQVNSARRTLNAASENPGEFDLAGDARWVAYTIAIRPAPAGPGITLTPDTGPAATVTTISGSGFAASTAGYIWFDANSNGSRDGGANEPEVAVTTTAGGAIPGSTTLTVPSVTAAVYPVRADIPTGGSVEAWKNFTVTPSWTINASAGAGGTISPSGAVVVLDGDDQTFDIPPNTNYVVSDVVVDSVSQGRRNSYTFNDVSADHTIVASFEDGGWHQPANNADIGVPVVGNPGNAYTSNNEWAEYDSSSDVNSYYGFGFSIPDCASIQGIQVAVEGKKDSCGSGRTWDVSLSYDGGSHWTTPVKNTGGLQTYDTTIILGGSGDNWGYGSWTSAIINSDNFRVRMDATSDGCGNSIWLDQVQVKVYYVCCSIGDLVWDDLNHNGIQDGGESGIPGVTVDLYNTSDALLDTDTTDANGIYGFTDLAAGTYYVKFSLPSGYVFSPKDQGGDNAKDSDADTTSGKTANITLVAGQNDPTWDAGMYQLGSISDFVWNDLDGDGIQDAGEAGISGVTVELYDTGNNKLATDTTDANGIYGFTDLAAGTYYVKFSLPSGYVFSPKDQGGDNAQDSDVDPSTGKTGVFTLGAGVNDSTWDCGLHEEGGTVELALIGDFVWNDLDGDGIQDAGEAGISGVTVDLYNTGDTLLDTDTTDANGIYGFTDLAAGTYYVKFSLPSGYVFSPKDQGGDNAKDSDADTTSGKTANITLVAGQNDPTWDAGMYQLGSISDFVWNDLDGDGIQDAGELGIVGVTVNLYRVESPGILIGTTTTDGNGLYIFTNLPLGQYELEFVAPPGYVFSPKDQGGDNAQDSDVDPSTGKTGVFTLGAGVNDSTWDCGLHEEGGTVELALIGDFVWNDLNGDGIQDGGELGIGGVTVNLYNSVGNLEDTTTTSGGGYYSFGNLEPGDYYLQFVKLAGYTFSPKDQGGDDKDSDADPTTGETATTTLDPDETDLDWDAGMYEEPGIVELATISDFVWNDLDGDGIQDAGEVGINGVTVKLYKSDGTLVGTETTIGGGLYSFGNLEAGNYYLQFVKPAGYTFSPKDQGGNAKDSDADPTTGKTDVFTLGAGESDPTWDAGLRSVPTSVGGEVYPVDKIGVLAQWLSWLLRLVTGGE